MIEFAKNLAVNAGTLALSERRNMDAANIHRKSNVRDLVTDTDRHVENFIVNAIKNRFPDHDIYGEETGSDRHGSDYCWIIDPIDGTSSFVHNSFNWCVSIALFYKGKPEIGVVYAPMMGDLYYASRGNGAFCNGVKINVSAISEMCDAIVGVGLFCLRAGWKEENNLKFISRIAPELCDLRKNGSAALDMCFVARGLQEGFWELSLETYDFAAAWLILTEAGGVLTDLYGGENFPQHGIICSNGVLHDKLLSCFTDYQHLRR